MKNTVGTKNYNGTDWFWPHDFRHYLRDANSRQRKLVHNGWLKIGVPVKKTGLKISDRYLDPKKNQMKKAWTIVKKVIAPKELESVNEFVPNMAVINKPAYKKMLDREISKGVKVKTALNNKNHDDHKKAKSLIQRLKDRLMKKEGFADKLAKKMKKHKGTNVKKKKKVKLKGRWVYQDYDGLKEATYQLPKRYTATNIDELDAALNRAGINGIPDFTKKTWTTMHDKVNHSKLKKIMKKIGAKKIKEGSCGYGVDGKLGKEPAGPHLLKKKKKKVDEIIKLKDILLENPADYVDKDIDNIELLRRKKKYESVSVDENREIDKVYGDFEVLLRDFEKEFISLSAQAGRANDNKADERIMLKTLKKHLPPLYSMVRSWSRSTKRD